MTSGGFAFCNNSATRYTESVRAERLRKTLGEKLFDLANLSAAVLIFGKFLDPAGVPDWVLWVGGFTFVALYLTGSLLVYFGGD